MKIYNREVDVGDWDGDYQVLTPTRTEEAKRIRRELGDQGGVTCAHRKWTPRSDGISNTITSITKDNMVIEPVPLRVRQATKQGYIECPVGGVMDLSYPSSTKRRGRVQDGGMVTPALTRNTESSLFRYEGIMKKEDNKTNDEMEGMVEVEEIQDVEVIKNTEGAEEEEEDFGKKPGLGKMTLPSGKEVTYKIRKLTPRECFRLMDVSEEDIDKIQASGISKTQQYKLAGNSIVVSCLYHIFLNLFTDQPKETLF